MSGSGTVATDWWPSSERPGLYFVMVGLVESWAGIGGGCVDGFAVVDDFGNLVRVPDLHGQAQA